MRKRADSCALFISATLKPDGAGGLSSDLPHRHTQWACAVCHATTHAVPPSEWALPRCERDWQIAI